MQRKSVVAPPQAAAKFAAPQLTAVGPWPTTRHRPRLCSAPRAPNFRSTSGPASRSYWPSSCAHFSLSSTLMCWSPKIQPSPESVLDLTSRPTVPCEVDVAFVDQPAALVGPLNLKLALV